ncbi:hypothetical protein M422DRAFT_245420 [Sphaerobolus stellatus SS14]|nr:hypothetical protein M422DRAFT_245420 [Sphaerobolus stellatus SS14]
MKPEKYLINYRNPGPSGAHANGLGESPPQGIVVSQTKEAIDFYIRYRRGEYVGPDEEYGELSVEELRNIQLQDVALYYYMKTVRALAAKCVEHPERLRSHDKILVVISGSGNRQLLYTRRQPSQKVPKLNKFLADNLIIEDGLTREQGTALLGARMVGRWKSSAPIELALTFDDPVLGADPNRNNNFTFERPGQDILSDQTNCPFTAHIRKAKPRADFPASALTITSAEAASNITVTERGLAFVAYQSDLSHGSQFIQQNWANNVGKNVPKGLPGWDLTIGANNG